jgi:SAM-dependent methyltransferase
MQTTPAAVDNRSLRRSASPDGRRQRRQRSRSRSRNRSTVQPPSSGRPDPVQRAYDTRPRRQYQPPQQQQQKPPSGYYGRRNRGNNDRYRQQQRPPKPVDRRPLIDQALSVGLANGRPEGSARDATEPLRRAVNGLKRVLLSRFVRPGNDVLDLACGQGADLPKFAHLRIRSYFGVDFASAALDESRHRAATNSRFKRTVKSLRYLQTDLRTNVVKLPEPVDVVSCQLALHYLVAEDFHLDNVLQTVRDSLRVGGHFLITIVDSARIPVDGITDHPFVRLSAVRPMQITLPPLITTDAKSADDGKTTTADPETKSAWIRTAYTFRFPGLVGPDDDGLPEVVIPFDRLVERAAKFSLVWHTAIRLEDVRAEVDGFSPNGGLRLRPEDEPVAALYVAHAFRRQ